MVALVLVVEVAIIGLVILMHVGELMIGRKLLWLHLVGLLILNALDREILLEWLHTYSDPVGGLLLELMISGLEVLIL